MGTVILSCFAVRSYEVDSYSHLNNGVYLGWFEQGRLDWLLSHGFSYDGFAARREWMVVARTEVDFRAPLVATDRARMTTEVAALGRSSVRFRQRLQRWEGGPLRLEPHRLASGEKPPEGRLCAEALTIMVFSGEMGRSIPIPADFRAAAESAELPRPA